MGYATLVRYARENLAKGMKNEEAMDEAVQRCINEGILKDYLLKKRSEAVRMFLTEFDEDTWRESMREEGREEGRKEGREEGHKESAELINYLWSNGRGEDAQKASKDKDFLEKLLAEFKSGMLTDV